MTHTEDKNTGAAELGHGGNVWAAARRIGPHSGDLLDLSTNVFAAVTSLTTACVRTTMRAHAEGGDFLHYPDPDSRRLRATLASAEGVESANILPGGGASEMIWAAFTALRPRHALFMGPMFSQYAKACDALRIPWTVVTPPERSPACTLDRASGFMGGFAPDARILCEVEASRHTGVDVVVACSPNNPGTALLCDPAPLLEAVGERTLILDASYRDFLWGQNFLEEWGTAGNKAGIRMSPAWEQHRFSGLAQAAAPFGCRVVLVGSLTKFFCCPGVRLGWLASDGSTVARVASARPAWTVPALAEEVGMALLAHVDEYRAALPGLRDDVAHLTALLRSSGLFRRVLSGVSFATAALHKPEQALSLREFLLERHHLLIRVCDNIPGMLPGFVRIQARARADDERLAQGLRKFKEQIFWKS